MSNPKFIGITLIISNLIVMGFLGGSDGKKKKKKVPAMWETQVQSMG